MATVAANLKLQPADAVEYFRRKGLQLTWDWDEMQRDAHSHAFTVAKVTSLDVLRTIRDQVDKAVASGTTFEEFQRTLRPRLQAAGWWGVDQETGAQLGSTRRLRTIYQTNVQTAYMAGRFQRYLDDAATRPYWRYVAILDGRTRPAHRALHGKVWRFDDPIWQVIWPPNGWGCRCRVQALTEEEFRALGVPLEDGRDAVSTAQVVVNTEGDTVDVRVVRYTDERGREQTFRPDPGWDYNPGAEYAGERAAARLLADKVDRVPAQLGSAAAANITANTQALERLEAGWQGFVADALADPAPGARTGLAGFLRPQDVKALADRGMEAAHVPIAVDAARVASSLADLSGNAVTAAQWSGLFRALQTPQAVLLDRVGGSLIYLVETDAAQARGLVVRTSTRAAEWSRLADLQAALDGGQLELLEGVL